MIWIKKQKEPASLTQFRKGGGKWTDFSLERGKKDLKKQLLLEQGNFCAYCMQRINFEKMKVEHWCSLSDCPEDRSLDYSNLLAVCQGKFPGVEHCDTCKKEQLMDISPLQKIHIDQIYYGKASGEIFSDNQNHQKEINALLNLNIQPLKDNRKKALTIRVQKRIGKKIPWQNS